jgi:hypothetical protein
LLQPRKREGAASLIDIQATPETHAREPG